jgi:hypothetical protein
MMDTTATPGARTRTEVHYVVHVEGSEAKKLSGTLRTSMRLHIFKNPTNLFPNAEFVLDRFTGSIICRNISKAAVEAAVDVARDSMGVDSHRQMPSRPWVEEVKVEVPVQEPQPIQPRTEPFDIFAHARAELIEGYEAVLSDKDAQIRGQDQKIDVFKREKIAIVAIKDNALLEATDAKRQAEEARREAKQAKADLESLKESQKAEHKPTEFEDIVRGWAPNAERVNGDITGLFGPKAHYRQLVDAERLGAQGMFPCVQDRLRSVGVEIETEAELQNLLKNVSWEESDVYKAEIGGIRKARANIEFVEKMGTLGVDIPEPVAQAIKALDIEGDKSKVASFEEARVEFEKMRSKRDVALDAQKEYALSEAVKRVTASWDDLPTLPIFVRSNPTTVTISFPGTSTEGPLDLALAEIIYEAFEGTPFVGIDRQCGSVTAKVSDPAMSAGGIQDAVNLGVEIKRKFFDSGLGDLGIKINLAMDL